MIIKKPEDTDLFFKKKLAQMPVDYTEADWGNLDKLLDKAKPAAQIKAEKKSVRKIIVIVAVLGVIAASVLVWLKYEAPDKTQPGKDAVHIPALVDSMAPLTAPEIHDVKKEEKNIQKKNRMYKEEPANAFKPVIADTLKQREESKHIFW